LNKVVFINFFAQIVFSTLDKLMVQPLTWTNTNIVFTNFLRQGKFQLQRSIWSDPAPIFNQKYFNLSYRVGTTWGWV